VPQARHLVQEHPALPVLLRYSRAHRALRLLEQVLPAERLPLPQVQAAQTRPLLQGQVAHLLSLRVLQARLPRVLQVHPGRSLWVALLAATQVVRARVVREATYPQSLEPVGLPLLARVAQPV
jgi:hypothetical protein